MLSQEAAYGANAAVDLAVDPGILASCQGPQLGLGALYVRCSRS